ncbi:hypothetical protein GW17_00036477, partial [Ensete ventricosum]
MRLWQREEDEGWPVVRRRQQRVTVVRIATVDGRRQQASDKDYGSGWQGWLGGVGGSNNSGAGSAGRQGQQGKKRGCEGCGWQRRKEDGSDSPVRVAAAGERRGPA